MNNIETKATYLRESAIAAQREYCERNEMPTMHLPPTTDGYCDHCGRNIYDVYPLRGGAVCGISVEQAGKKFITCCPHCNHSFLS